MANGTPATKPAPVLAPQGIYVTGEDYLLLTSIASVAGLAIELGGRVLDAKACPVPFSQRHVANSDRTTATTPVRIGEGWLQQVSVGVASGTPQYGQAYVRVDICRGDGAGRTVLGTLLAGNITSTVRQAWPGSLLHGPNERGGAIRSITGTDPAAGAEISETVPTGARWTLRGFQANLVTSAVAGNREVNLVFDDGTATFFQMASNVAHAASLTKTYNASTIGAQFAAAVGIGVHMPIPQLALSPGHRIRTATANLDVGDNWGAPQLLVDETLEG